MMRSLRRLWCRIVGHDYEETLIEFKHDRGENEIPYIHAQPYGICRRCGDSKPIPILSSSSTTALSSLRVSFVSWSDVE